MLTLEREAIQKQAEEDLRKAREEFQAELEKAHRRQAVSEVLFERWDNLLDRSIARLDDLLRQTDADRDTIDRLASALARALPSVPGISRVLILDMLGPSRAMVEARMDAVIIEFQGFRKLLEGAARPPLPPRPRTLLGGNPDAAPPAFATSPRRYRQGVTA